MSDAAVWRDVVLIVLNEVKNLLRFYRQSSDSLSRLERTLL